MNVTAEDGGEYFCHAENSQGATTTALAVQVKGYYLSIYYLFISIILPGFRARHRDSCGPRQLLRGARSVGRVRGHLPRAPAAVLRPGGAASGDDRLKMSLLCLCLVFCLALFALMQVKAEAEINTDIPHLVYFASVRCGVLKSWICRVYDWQQIIHRV